MQMSRIHFTEAEDCQTIVTPDVSITSNSHVSLASDHMLKFLLFASYRTRLRLHQGIHLLTEQCRALCTFGMCDMSSYMSPNNVCAVK